MLNPIEKFKVAILHLNRAWNHWYTILKAGLYDLLVVILCSIFGMEVKPEWKETLGSGASMTQRMCCIFYWYLPIIKSYSTAFLKLTISLMNAMVERICPCRTTHKLTCNNQELIFFIFFIYRHNTKFKSELRWINVFAQHGLLHWASIRDNLCP